MTVSLSPALALGDALACAGWGFLLAGIYGLGRLLFGSGFWACLILDVLGLVLAAVVLCGYAAGQSAAGVPRWFHLLGMALGAGSFFACAGRAIQRWHARIVWLLTRPAAVLKLWLGGTARRRVTLRRKNEKISPEITEKQLPKNKRMLYNSR